MLGVIGHRLSSTRLLGLSSCRRFSTVLNELAQEQSESKTETTKIDGAAGQSPNTESSFKQYPNKIFLEGTVVNGCTYREDKDGYINSASFVLRHGRDQMEPYVVRIFNIGTIKYALTHLRNKSQVLVKGRLGWKSSKHQEVVIYAEYLFRIEENQSSSKTEKQEQLEQ